MSIHKNIEPKPAAKAPESKGPEPVIPGVADMDQGDFPLPEGKRQTVFENRGPAVESGEIVCHPSDQPAPLSHSGQVINPEQNVIPEEGQVKKNPPKDPAEVPTPKPSRK